MRKISFGFALVLMLVGCKSAFTTQLRNEFDKSNLSLNRVQFYVSDRIILRRSSKVRESKINTRGEYVKSKEDTIVNVEIMSNTPGGLVKEDGDILYVKFSADNAKSLPFKLKGRKYVFYAPDEKIDFGGEEYRVVKGADSFLEIVVDENVDDREKVHVEPGFRVNR